MTKSAMLFAILMPAGMQGCSPIDHRWSRSTVQSFGSRTDRTGSANAAEIQRGPLSLNYAMDPGASKASSAPGGWCGMIALIHGEGAK